MKVRIIHENANTETYIEKIIIKRYFLSLFSISFKKTGYDRWSISGLSKHSVDLRKVIFDFNMPTFITYSYLSYPKSRTFVHILFSRFKMGSFMLWRLLKRWLLWTAKYGQRKVFPRVYFRTKLKHGTNRVPKNM